MLMNWFGTTVKNLNASEKQGRTIRVRSHAVCNVPTYWVRRYLRYAIAQRAEQQRYSARFGRPTRLIHVQWNWQLWAATQQRYYGGADTPTPPLSQILDVMDADDIPAGSLFETEAAA